MKIKGVFNKSASTPAILVLSFVFLISASVGFINTVYRTQRAYIADHLQANLQATVEYIHLVIQDQLAQVSVTASNKTFIRLASATLANPADGTAKAALEEWLTGVYPAEEKYGYALLALDGTISAATVRELEGSPLQRKEFLALLDQLRHGDGVAATPLIEAVRVNPLAPVGALFQAACAHIRSGDSTRGYFCLLAPASSRLFGALRVARTGLTGEAYLIDAEARIKSPSRFVDQAAALYARAPATASQVSSAARGADGALTQAGALTKIADALLNNKRKQTGYLENYRDYRGVPVAGVGQWLDELGVGVIVEEDVSEAFYASRISSLAIAALTVLAMVLIGFLLFVQSRARRRLVESELLSRVFRDNSPNGLLLQDLRGTVLMTNPVPGTLFHWPQGDAVGKSTAELFPAKLVGLFEEARRELMKGEPLVKQMHEYVEANATVRLLRIVHFPVRNADHCIGFGTVFSDVTAEHHAQKVLEDMNRELEVRVEERTHELMLARDKAEAAAHAKSDFLANMSHEIRTPLNAILGMSYLARQRNTDPQVAQQLRRIHTSGQHLLGVVNSILDFSKLEAGKFTVAREEFSLMRVLDHSVSLIAEEAASKNLELRIHIEPDIPDKLIGDAQHIAQILINFASNAVKFTERGEIAMRVTRVANDGDRVRLRFSVQDSGVGIAEEQLTRLFQPFEQLDMSTTRQVSGTGLGLVISSRIAQLLGGSVGVVSALGKGSTFFAELPLELGHADLRAADAPHLDTHCERVADAAAEDRAAVVAQPRFLGQRILLVEDNQVNREVATAFLKLLGLSFATANNGAQALELLNSDSFELVLMDLHMPVMDGLQATQVIRNNPAWVQLPIIALTADVISANLEKLREAGVNDILGKPIDPDALHHVLLKWLPRRAAELCGEQALSVSAGSMTDGEKLRRLKLLPALDVDRALTRMMGIVEIYLEFVENVVADSDRMERKLCDAIAAVEISAAHDIVHNLKSLCASMGAAGIADLCARIEADLMQERWCGAELNALVGDWALLKSQLKESIGRV